MAHSDTFSIHSTLKKGKLPRLPFLRMKEAILGKRFMLSLVFIGDKRAQTLNKTYRKKTYIPDVLTFPLDANEGEMFINPHQAKRRAKEFDMDTERFIALLFIHGLLHLKGVPHGSRMERLERAHLKRFFS